MKYKVTISRTEYQLAEFVVDADTQEEAENKAFQEAYDLYWRRGSAEYELESIQELDKDT